jgi:hypothetical protein
MLFFESSRVPPSRTGEPGLDVISALCSDSSVRSQAYYYANLFTIHFPLTNPTSDQDQPLLHISFASQHLEYHATEAGACKYTPLPKLHKSEHSHSLPAQRSQPSRLRWLKQPRPLPTFNHPHIVLPSPSLHQEGGPACFYSLARTAPPDQPDIIGLATTKVQTVACTYDDQP